MQDLRNDRSGLLYRRALLVLAVLQLGLALVFWDVPALPEAAAMHGLTRPPELPPIGFFSIWFVIFATHLGFAVWAWREDNHVTRTLAVPLGLASICILALLALQRAGLTQLDLTPLVLALWGISAWAARRFDLMRGMGGSPGKWAGDATTGLLLGWTTLTLYLFLIGNVRDIYGLASTDAVWPFLLATLALTGAMALASFARLTSSPYFLLAICWGLFGIFANLWWVTGLNAPAVITGLFAIWLVRRRLRFGASGAKPAGL